MGSRKDLSRDLFLVEIEISKEETDFLVVGKDGLANGVEDVPKIGSWTYGIQLLHLSGQIRQKRQKHRERKEVEIKHRFLPW